MSLCQKSLSLRQQLLVRPHPEGSRRRAGAPGADQRLIEVCPSGKGQDAGGGKTEKTLADFAAEYAKSSRSTCKGCMEKIEKVGGASWALLGEVQGQRGGVRCWLGASGEVCCEDLAGMEHMGLLPFLRGLPCTGGSKGRAGGRAGGVLAPALLCLLQACRTCSVSAHHQCPGGLAGTQLAGAVPFKTWCRGSRWRTVLGGRTRPTPPRSP